MPESLPRLGFKQKTVFEVLALSDPEISTEFTTSGLRGNELELRASA